MNEWISENKDSLLSKERIVAIICNCFELSQSESFNTQNLVESLVNNDIKILSLCKLNLNDDNGPELDKYDELIDYYSLSNVLLSNIMENVSNNSLNNNSSNTDSNIVAKEIFGRVTCNADYFVDYFDDFMIGKKIDGHQKEARNKVFSQMMKEWLNDTLNDIIDKTGYIERPHKRNLVYSVTGMRDNKGETASIYLRRIIETGRITGSKYHAKLYDSESGVGMHIVVTMGLYFQQNQESDKIHLDKNHQHVPCTIKWDFEYRDSTNDLHFQTTNFDFLDVFAYQVLNTAQLCNNSSIQSEQLKIEL